MLLLNCFILNFDKKKLTLYKQDKKFLSIRNLNLNFKIRIQATYSIEFEFCNLYGVKEKEMIKTYLTLVTYFCNKLKSKFYVPKFLKKDED